MKNKKPLIAITGASSGIGKATAELFASKGYPILVMARRDKELEKIPAEFKIVAKVDVTDLKQVQDAIAKAEAVFGPVDMIFNNAGTMPLGDFITQPESEKEMTLDVNIKGVMNGMTAVLPGMVERQTGTIINTSSVAGRWVSAEHSVYNAAKFAVNALTTQVRREHAKDNIRFTLLEPAFVNTPLADGTSDKAILEKYLSNRDALGGGLTPAEVAEVVLNIYEMPQHISIKEVVLSHTKQAI
ncbi:SDR family oxidoreductase [[Acholeplasma] multilocale]|uniref:SDR family oxidoreductase n=1 Tax=[Acholeplasma] multilocale TaxID=264638 RepID=UPI00041606B6|nr:SDR family oxidoreductase [[Acholeplasma] multilocale]